MKIFTKTNAVLVLAFLILTGLAFAGNQPRIEPSPLPSDMIQFVSSNSDTVYVNSYYCYPQQEEGAHYKFICKNEKLWWK